MTKKIKDDIVTVRYWLTPFNDHSRSVVSFHFFQVACKQISGDAGNIHSVKKRCSPVLGRRRHQPHSRQGRVYHHQMSAGALQSLLLPSSHHHLPEIHFNNTDDYVGSTLTQTSTPVGWWTELSAVQLRAKTYAPTNADNVGRQWDPTSARRETIKRIFTIMSSLYHLYYITYNIV